MSISPMERGQAAAAAQKAGGASAMACALTHIGVAFDLYSTHYRLRATVRRSIRRGAADRPNRGRYGRMLSDLPAGVTLDAAVILIERRYRGYCEHQENIARLWRRPPPRHNASPLAELRLGLRWLRRYQPAMWPYVLDNLTAPVWAGEVMAMEAAE